MKLALTCQHCLACTALPEDEYGRDSVVDWFAQVHAGHLENEEMIVVVEHVRGDVYREVGRA